MKTHEIAWEGIIINISHASKWGGVIDHIEVRAEQPIPITETGYRSIFLSDCEIEQAGGAVELVKSLLDKEATSSSWQEYLKASRQETLF